VIQNTIKVMQCPDVMGCLKLDLKRGERMGNTLAGSFVSAYPAHPSDFAVILG
jgi:hypothetical protein